MEESSNSKGRLLIVEDDFEFAIALSTGLRLEGFVVEVAGSVAQAQEFLKREPVDLIITDWVLEDGTGAQVCEMAHQADPAMPMIVMSGLSTRYLKEAHQCKPSLYLDKPINMPQLYVQVQALLSKADEKS